jgi:diadenosine tetraphosphate (Ap4A) HIT family hydrolase
MSPTVFRENGYRFFFFSREEERMHVHVISGDGEAKYWLKPEIELAKNYKYTRTQLKQIEELIEVHYNDLISSWNTHFGS